MEYISLYRKWRPQRFDEVIGQEDVIKTLKNAVKSGRLAHAYLFCGPRGTGKTSTARIFAKAVNCKNIENNAKDPEPCNECDNCISITDGSNVDVIEFDAASHRSVDDADDLTKRVSYLPNLLKKKIYIIDEVHMLSKHAFNALLKTLEEPPEHVIFILATTAPEEIISTIVSRCQKYDFKPINQDIIKDRLKIAAAKENIDASDAALSLIAKYSQGSQRDAYVLLEKLSSLDNSRIKVEDAAALIGAVDNEILFELTNIFIEKNISELIFFMHRFEKSYYNIKVFTEEYLSHLQNLFVLKNYSNAFDILNIGEDYKEKYSDQAKSISNTRIELLIEIFSSFHNSSKELNLGSALIFKAALIKAISSPEVNTEDLLRAKKENYEEKIRVLEDRIKALESLEFKPEKKAYQEEPEKQEREKADAVKMKKTNEEENISFEAKEIKKNEILKEEVSNKSLDAEKEHKKENLKRSQQKNDSPLISAEKWDEILNYIKQTPKGVQLEALLKEVKSSSFKNNTVAFYVRNDQKFHKEMLSRPENMERVSEAVKKVIGMDLKISFLFEKEGSSSVEFKSHQNNQDEEHIPGEEYKNNSIKSDVARTEAGKNDEVKEKKQQYNENVKKDDDNYGYLIKKFNIKEKKSGS